jgi:hypothetical protein
MRSRRILAAAFGLWLVSVAAAEAQGLAGWVPKLVKIGKWAIGQLISYEAGKEIDNLMGEDYESQLRQVEDGLSREIRRGAKDSQLLKVQLAAAQSQIQTLHVLQSKKPIPAPQLEQHKRKIASGLEQVVAALKQHGVRIDELEKDMREVRNELGGVKGELSDVKVRLEKLERQGELPPRQEPPPEEPARAPRPWRSSQPYPREPYHHPSRSSRDATEGITLDLRITGSANRITLREVEAGEEPDSGRMTIAGTGQTRTVRVLRSTGAVVIVSGQDNTVSLSGDLCARARIVDHGLGTRKPGCR